MSPLGAGQRKPTAARGPEDGDTAPGSAGTGQGFGMHIGYVIPEFPGQTHSFFWREIEALEAKGAVVSLISTRRPPSHVMPHAWAEAAAARTFYLHPPSVAEAARTVAQLPSLLRRRRTILGRPPREMATLAALLPFALKLKAHCAAQGIEHLHLGSAGNTAAIAALSRLIGGPPYSLTLHNPVAIFGPSQDLKWGQAAFGAAITPDILDDLVARHGPSLPEEMFVQPMGVDIEKFRRTRPYAPWRPGETLRIFSCGRLNRVKGHEDLVAALRLLVSRGIEAELDIAGEDDHGGAGYRKVLQRCISESGLAGRVTLLGAVSEATIVDRLDHAHLFALASHAEPLGVVYMEAMSCGVPTIGTRAGGVPLLIRDGIDGVLIPPRDPEALARAIEAVATDAEGALAMARRARKTASRRFPASIGAERIFRAIATRQTGGAMKAVEPSSKE